MDFLLRVGLPIVIVAIALLQFGLESKWSDERLKGHRWARRILLGLLVLSGMGLAVIAVKDYSASEEQARLMEEQTALMATQAKALGSLEQKPDPVLELALAKFPDLSEEEAIHALVKSVEELKETTAALGAQDVFHPVSAQVRQTVVARLRALTSDMPLVVTLSVETGNRNRSLVAMELRKILREANIEGSTGSSVTATSRALPPVKIVFHKEDSELAQNIVLALFNGVVAGSFEASDSGQERGTIEIKIYGIPIFSPDGLYRFR